MIILVKQDGKTQATSFIAVTVRGSTSLAVTEQKGRIGEERQIFSIQHKYTVNCHHRNNFIIL